MIKHYFLFCFILAAISFCKKSDTVPDDVKYLSSKQIVQEGLRFHRMKNYESSASYFSYAVMKDKNNFEAYFNLARAYSMLNNPHDAIKALKIAYYLNPEWVRQHQFDTDLDSIRNLPDFINLFSDITIRILKRDRLSLQ